MDIAKLIETHDGIRVRKSDGYVCATDICKAGGKLWGNYWKSQHAQEYADALAHALGKQPESLIILEKALTSADMQGTWVRRLPSKKISLF